MPVPTARRASAPAQESHGRSGRQDPVKRASRYALIGMLVGLLAPAGLLIYGFAGRGGFDPVWLSALLAAGGMIVFAIVLFGIGRKDMFKTPSRLP
jgi:hypothetical protein